MVEKEIAFVKIQQRKSGSYMVTIPSDIVKGLGIKDNERLKVFVDEERERIIYELNFSIGKR